MSNHPGKGRIHGVLIIVSIYLLAAGLLQIALLRPDTGSQIATDSIAMTTYILVALSFFAAALLLSGRMYARWFGIIACTLNIPLHYLVMTALKRQIMFAPISDTPVSVGQLQALMYTQIAMTAIAAACIILLLSQPDRSSKDKGNDKE